MKEYTQNPKSQSRTFDSNHQKNIQLSMCNFLGEPKSKSLSRYPIKKKNGKIIISEKIDLIGSLNSNNKSGNTTKYVLQRNQNHYLDHGCMNELNAANFAFRNTHMVASNMEDWMYNFSLNMGLFNHTYIYISLVELQNEINLFLFRQHAGWIPPNYQARVRTNHRYIYKRFNNGVLQATGTRRFEFGMRLVNIGNDQRYQACHFGGLV